MDGRSKQTTSLRRTGPIGRLLSGMRYEPLRRKIVRHGPALKINSAFQPGGMVVEVDALLLEEHLLHLRGGFPLQARVREVGERGYVRGVDLASDEGGDRLFTVRRFERASIEYFGGQEKSPLGGAQAGRRSYGGRCPASQARERILGDAWWGR